MTERIDMVGKRIGRLVVVTAGPVVGDAMVATWNCRCDCGNTGIVRGDKLRRETTRSCGCLSPEATAARSRSHGMASRGPTRPPEYSVWAQMVQRCTNPKNTSWARYGGRGIRVCFEWLKFPAWFAAMGPRPSRRHSIDRINNEGNYEPGNVRWATPETQMANRRNSVTPNGEVR